MKKLLTSKLEGCPVAIFDDRYKHIRKENFKNKHGIYALYDKNGKLYYVGRASDLSGRMNQHLKHNRHSKKWEYFSVYFTATRDEAYALEAIILSICPPKGNRKNAEVSKVAKDTEMRRRIEKQINDTDKNRMQFRVPGIPAKNKKGKINKADQYIRKTVSQGSAQKRKLRLKDLFSNGFLRGPQTLKAKYKTKTFFATLLPSGEIEYQGKKYLTPSRVAMVAKKSKSENGWTVWKIQNSSNKWITLDECVRNAPLVFKAKSKSAVSGQRKFLQKKEGNSDKASKAHFFNRETLPLQAKYKAKIYRAKLLSCGKQVQYEGKIYSSPTAVAKTITGYSSISGRAFWSAQTSPGKWVKLENLKKSIDKGYEHQFKLSG